MMDTTAMMVRTPMMIPSKVRNVRSLLDQREFMAMATDSLTLILVILFFIQDHYI